jgi:hypothetical protein
MALQYLEAFKALGQSPSTKYILPLEVTQLADSFRGFLEGSNVPGSAPSTTNAPASPAPVSSSTSPASLPEGETAPDRPTDAG